MKAAIIRPLYDYALDGLPLLGTPAELAARYRSRPGPPSRQADEMAATHILLSTSAGFVCGLGGFLTLPVTLPANVAAVALIQLHLTASTAHLADLDPGDEAVREACLACVTGATADPGRDELQEAVDRSAVKVAERGLRLLAEGVVGLAEFAARAGTKRALAGRLPRRSLPLVGGLIGGASDYHATRRVAEAARNTFVSDKEVLRDLLENGSA